MWKYLFVDVYTSIYFVVQYGIRAANSQSYMFYLTQPVVWGVSIFLQTFAVQLCPFRNHLFISAAVIMEIGHSLFGVKLLRPHRERHLNINSVTGKTRQLFPCFLQFNEELFDADPCCTPDEWRWLWENDLFLMQDVTLRTKTSSYHDGMSSL